MNLIKNNVKYSRKSKQEEPATGSLCPNCWGRQEYEKQFYKPIKTKSLKEEKERKGWILNYLQEHTKSKSFVPQHKKKQVCNVCYTNDN